VGGDKSRGSTSCVKMAEDLNRRFRQCKSDEARPVDSTSFSIATNGTEARLYVSWKHHELEYSILYGERQELLALRA
jgi:hypothetical protein